MASGARRRPFHPIAKSSGVISKKILSSVSPPPCNRRGLSANCTRPVRVVWHGQVDVPGVRKMRDDLRHRIVALRAPRIRMRLRARSKMEFFRRSAKRFEGVVPKFFLFLNPCLNIRERKGTPFRGKKKGKLTTVPREWTAPSFLHFHFPTNPFVSFTPSLDKEKFSKIFKTLPFSSQTRHYLPGSNDWLKQHLATRFARTNPRCPCKSALR